MGAFMMDASLMVVDHLLRLHSHARPPELVLSQVEYMLLTLVSSISMTSIHGGYSMSCGDYKLQNFFQLVNQYVAMVESILVECELLLLPKGGHSLFNVGVLSQEMLQILYVLSRDPFDQNLPVE